MNTKKTTNQLISQLMSIPEIDELSDERQREIYHMVIEMVMSAKEDVVKDAEKAISKLRTFSIR
jgi:hypothetical protein